MGEWVWQETTLDDCTIGIHVGLDNGNGAIKPCQGTVRCIEINAEGGGWATMDYRCEEHVDLCVWCWGTKTLEEKDGTETPCDRCPANQPSGGEQE